MTRISRWEALDELVGALEILGELQADPEVDEALVREASTGVVRMGAQIQNQIRREKDKPPWLEH